MASGSKPASGDKKKSKKSSRSSAEVSSRSKDRKSKDKKSSSKKEKPAATAQPVAAPPPIVTTPPVAHDPDAIQLFRRYDRNRSGVLTRLDFLQLLRDYADPASGWGTTMSRPPLSLTDTRGIPLGYQRADKNSEFEAGQLFERYDKDRKGALDLDMFHVFFWDFKPQLRAFVEESNYRLLAPPQVTIVSAPPRPVQEEEPVVITTVRGTASGSDATSPKAIRAQYRAALWKLRKICKDELFDQRENIVQQLKAIREIMANRQRESSRNSSGGRWTESRHSKRRPRSSPYPEFDDDLRESDTMTDKDETKRYEEMEDDLDKVDEIIRYVRRFLSKGDNVSRREMQDFIEQAESLEEEAQCLAMKHYDKMVQHGLSTPSKEKDKDPPPASTTTSPPVEPSPAPPSDYQKQTELQGLLRVKDQMIYQLLQERTAMRKERTVVEASLKKLSDVSTREMKKWARLTDDMQAEIEQLRSQLRSQSQQRAV